jgi:hypothetical protein
LSRCSYFFRSLRHLWARAFPDLPTSIIAALLSQLPALPSNINCSSCWSSCSLHALAGIALLVAGGEPPPLTACPSGTVGRPLPPAITTCRVATSPSAAVPGTSPLLCPLSAANDGSGLARPSSAGIPGATDAPCAPPVTDGALPFDRCRRAVGMPAWGECGGEDASVELRFKCDSSPPGTIRGEQPREVELGRSHARGARCAVWLRADCPPPSRPANTKIGRVLASVAADAMVLLMSAGASHLGPWLRPPMQLPGRLLPPPGLRRSGWGALTPLGLAMGRRLKTFLMPCLLLSMTRMIYDLLLSSDSPRRRCLRIRSPCLAGLSQECSTGRTLLPFTVTRNTSDRRSQKSLFFI